MVLESGKSHSEIKKNLLETGQANFSCLQWVLSLLYHLTKNRVKIQMSSISSFLLKQPFHLALLSNSNPLHSLGLDILAGEGGAEPSRELPVDVFLLRVPSLRCDLGGRGLVKEEVMEECG